MGHRLHYAKTYTVEYDGGYFNWQTEEWSELLSAEFDLYTDESDSDIELDPEQLKRYLDKLEQRPADEPSLYFNDCTNHDEYEALKEIYDGYDHNNDYINLVWF